MLALVVNFLISFVLPAFCFLYKELLALSVNSQVQGVHYFSKNFNILRPLLRKDRAAIGCTENGPPIRETQISDQMS